MAGIYKGDGSLPEDVRCKRSDGKGWRCRLPVAEGKSYCETHLLQFRHRQLKEPVPDNLKLERTRRPSVLPKIEETESSYPLRSSDLPRRRGKRMNSEESVEHLSSSVPRKRRKSMIKEESVEISDSDDSTGSPKVNLGVSGSRSVPTGMIRSKNVEIATEQKLPSIQANKKAAANKKITKKCHWCKWSSYRVFVKCETCKKHFFCQECIDQRFHDKAAVKRECPVCLGTCCCRVCTRGRPKEVKTKALVVDNGEKELVVDDREKELVVDGRDNPLVVYDLEKEVAVNHEKQLVVYNREKKFGKIQPLHMIEQLLPLMEKINHEKMTELDTEAKNKGRIQGELPVPVARCSQEQQCWFCKAWIADLHRSCQCCPYILCILCCHEFRDGSLHSALEDLKNTKRVRSKTVRKIKWRFCVDGSIRCPKNLGGCGLGILELTCFSPFNWTKDLEASGKQLLCKYKYKKPFGVVSSPCLLCEGNDQMGSKKVGDLIENKGFYFSTKQDLKEKDLEHFMKHWGSGQPLIIRDLLQSQQALSWDFGFLLCEYLKRSAESRKDAEQEKSKIRTDCCEVQFGRKQIFMGGTTYENVWIEFLKFEVWLSSAFFQDHFPDHYTAVMKALPFQEYTNPLSGFLNLAVKLPQNPNLGPCVYISYGGPEDFMGGDLTKLRWNTHDVVNILAHTTEHPISERKLNEVKILMNKYNSQDHIKSLRKIRIRNKIEELFGSSSDLEDDTNGELTCMPSDEVHLSDDSSSEGSDDEDSPQYKLGTDRRFVDTHGAEWDIFRREDVPKLIEYLRKNSNKLSKSYDSPEKVVHPLFDELCFLDDLHKERLKEEFDVEPWSLEQRIGEAVIIPAGCPYQMKKIKSCVNVVLEFISPESSSVCIQVNDELRRLPANHKAKAKRVEVKRMVINGMNAAIEEISKVSETEWSWPLLFLIRQGLLLSVGLKGGVRGHVVDSRE